MRLKAQSELAGDRKRRAEMTRPRHNGGVTNWMFDNKMRATIDSHVSTPTANPLAKLAKPDTLTTADTYDNEVNQSPLRAATPGVYSVNSAEVCPPLTIARRSCASTGGFLLLALSSDLW